MTESMAIAACQVPVRGGYPSYPYTTMMKHPSASACNLLDRARCSLDGLSIGDACGERFFVHPDTMEYVIAERALPPGHSPATPRWPSLVLRSYIARPLSIRMPRRWISPLTATPRWV